MTISPDAQRLTRRHQHGRSKPPRRDPDPGPGDLVVATVAPVRSRHRRRAPAHQATDNPSVLSWGALGTLAGNCADHLYNGQPGAKDTAAESPRPSPTLAITAQQARADVAGIRRGDEECPQAGLLIRRIDAMQRQLNDYMARRHAVDKTRSAGADQLLVRWRPTTGSIPSIPSATIGLCFTRWHCARTMLPPHSTSSTKH